MNDNLDFQLPPDVRRVASPRTLRVMFGGVSKRWKLVKNGIMLLIGPWFRLGCKSIASHWLGDYRNGDD